MESRVTRYSRKNKLKRKMTKLFKSILKNMIYLIVGIFSAMYFGLKAFNRLIEKLFNKLPRVKYNYFDIGLDTLEKIQPKYCPIGAANDPTGLNKYWLSGTQKKYNELIGK